MEIIDPNAEPEIPSFAVPMAVKLPLIGEVSTLIVAVVAAVLVIVLLFLLGFLIGRSGRNDGGYDDEPPTPPAPRYREEPKAAPKAPVERKAAEKPKAEPAPVKKEAPVKAAPVAAPKVEEKPKEEKKVVPVDDGLDSPFVEDLSSAVQEELHQRREAAEDKLDNFFVESTYTEDESDTDKSVSTMSLQELLDDIHNM